MGTTCIIRKKEKWISFQYISLEEEKSCAADFFEKINKSSG